MDLWRGTQRRNPERNPQSRIPLPIHSVAAQDIRGLAPYPTAWSVLDGQIFKIHRVSVTASRKEATVGDYATDNKTYVYVKASDGWVSIDELQPEGKKRMVVGDFLRGNKFGNG